MLKKLTVFLLSICLALSCSLSGCNNYSNSQDKLKISTSFYPIYIMTINIVDGVPGVSVDNIADQNIGCLHDFQLQADDVKAIENSDLFIVNGAGMESFLDDLIKEQPNLSIIDSSKDIDLIYDEHYHDCSLYNANQEHNYNCCCECCNIDMNIDNNCIFYCECCDINGDNNCDCCCECCEDCGNNDICPYVKEPFVYHDRWDNECYFTCVHNNCSKIPTKIDYHEECEYNPHIWVSISNYIKQVQNISNGIMELDPQNAEKYKKNTEKYIEKLTALREQMHYELDNLPNRDIITFHEAFPYFAQEFNLNIAAVINREPNSEPSAKELYETINIINQTGIRSLFVEPQYSASMANVIAEETKSKVYVLDPASTGALNKDAYINIMKQNLSVLKEALS